MPWNIPSTGGRAGEGTPPKRVYVLVRDSNTNK